MGGVAACFRKLHAVVSLSEFGFIAGFAKVFLVCVPPLEWGVCVALQDADKHRRSQNDGPTDTTAHIVEKLASEK